jgi:multimeric flavodoxin WrbA
MRKVVAINGSPRKSGNTALMLRAFKEGIGYQVSGIGSVLTESEDKSNKERYREYWVNDLSIKCCTGCLRCNILKRCSLRDDDWGELSEAILEADVLVFASPIYFHHVTAQMKTIIDRFRSFVHVQITEKGIEHTPHHEWNKDFVLLLPMGSSDDSDAQPVIELFEYMCKILGPKNRLHVIKGTRLAMTNQITKSAEELEALYTKLQLPVELAGPDAVKNAELLEQCMALGQTLG